SLYYVVLYLSPPVILILTTLIRRKQSLLSGRRRSPAARLSLSAVYPSRLGLNNISSQSKVHLNHICIEFFSITEGLHLESDGAEKQ
ncbi:hypothetical protein F8388_004833, partial [Cannabis sativa]